MRGRLHKQRRVNTCAVAALRTVLDLQCGVKVAEEALEAHATTTEHPIQRMGASTREIRLMVQGVNRTHNHGKPWTFRPRRHGTIEDLARELLAGRIPMVMVYEEALQDYHMIVVLGVGDEGVKIFDPSQWAPPGPHWVDAGAFLQRWGGDGECTWYGVLGGGSL